MLKILLLSLLATSSTCFEFVWKAGPLVPATKGEVWPKPQSVDNLDSKYWTILPSFFKFENVGNTCSILEEALIRYRNIILFNSRKFKTLYYPIRPCYPQNDTFLGYFRNLSVDLTGVCNDDDRPSFEMKEEYNLTLTEGTTKLTSSTIWGILRGLETFSQLIYLTEDYSCHIIETVAIHDYPRLAHRGLLLDTARHYHSKDNILRTIEAMSYNKLNVFHWHIVDDYSFPYVSNTFPELSDKGAFHPTLMIYDQNFVQQVQEYARMRGIRVMVEFDTPGHTLSWGVGIPGLLTACHNVPRLEWGPLDVTKNSTYEVIFKLFEEIKEVFKDNYVHLGGDEVDTSCWKSNPDVNQFMAENGMEGDYWALQTYYIQKLIDYVKSLNLRSIVWEEVFTHGTDLPNDTIVQVWIADNPETEIDEPRVKLQEVTSQGHPAIISSWWYLDQLFTGGDWLKFYNEDPFDFDGTQAQKDLVIGAEACMWSEVVDDNNMESRVWPRASVAAEKFWSAPGPKLNANDFASVWPVAGRLQEQTCRMNRRGIKAQPPTGPSVCF